MRGSSGLTSHKLIQSRYPTMAICRKCQTPDLYWKATSPDTIKLSNVNSEIHTCPPITRADQVIQTGTISNPEPTPSTSGDLSSQAHAAVMDVVAAVHDSLCRTMTDIADRAQAATETSTRAWKRQMSLDVDDAYQRAKEEFRNLMPQQHELVVHTPIGDTITEGRPHFQLQRMVDWLNLREHVWAAGPAGSGKTTAASQAADVLGLPAYVLPCGMATNDWSLLGFTNPDGKYIPGHMRQPFEHGGVFVLDEIDNTNPSVLTTINGALSGSSYQFPDALVQRHPDFVVVGCANTWGTGPDRLYVGRNQLDAATLDRFKRVDWQYDEVAELDWAGRDQIEWTQYVQRVRKYASESSMRVVVSPRASVGGAKGLRNSLLWNDVAQDCLWNGMSEDDSTRILGSVGSR